MDGQSKHFISMLDICIYMRRTYTIHIFEIILYSSDYKENISLHRIVEVVLLIFFFSKYNLEVKANKDFEHFSILILNLHQFFCLKKLCIKIKEKNFQYECKITINFFFRSE